LIFKSLSEKTAVYVIFINISVTDVMEEGTKKLLIKKIRKSSEQIPGSNVYKNCCIKYKVH